MRNTDTLNVTHDDVAQLMARGRRERSKAFHAMIKALMRWLSPIRTPRSARAAPARLA